jgi:hypothetical protein
MFDRSGGIMTADDARLVTGSGIGRRSPKAKLLLAAVVIGMALTLWIAVPGLITTIRGIEGAPIGACVIIAEPGNVGSPEKVADCADPAANLVVLAHLGTERDCFTIAGSVRETGTPDRRTCLGKRGADPARSPNTAVEGECLTADTMERTVCAAGDARHRIVKRIDDVPTASADTACHGVPEADWASITTLEVGTSINGFGVGSVMSATSIVFCTAAIERDPTTS